GDRPHQAEPLGRRPPDPHRRSRRPADRGGPGMTLIRIRPLLFAVLTLLGCSGLTVAADEENAGERYDLVFLGGKRPVLLRLHLRVGHRPLHAVGLDSVAKLHACLDTDGNGTLTFQGAERADGPRLARAFAGAAPTRTLSLEALDSAPADGIVTV